MIDPIKFTNFKLNQPGLEGYILFSIAVAGKNALTTAKILDNLIDERKPFQSIRKYGSQKTLCSQMKKIGFGCYNLKSHGFWWIANSGLDLKKCSIEDLEKCPGIGMKTSRFFAMHTRPKCDVACLDVHILKYMRDIGHPNVPKQTPTRKKYLEIQEAFLNICRKKNIHPAVMDLQIWNEYRII